MTTPDSQKDDLGRLMQAAQRGDSACYRELLRIVMPRVRAIVVRQRGFAGTAEAEDLVQDVLLSLHAVRATYDPSRPFVPWLLAIVRNRFETNTDIAELGDADTLRAAVRELPDGQRQAIELLKLQELSLSEAAEKTGTSVGALKVATHRAMAALRRTLGSRRT